MKRLRGFLDAPMLLLFALLAIPWCFVSPASWERALDRLARRALFARTTKAEAEKP